ncbi:MAG: mannosyl-3-phosphoglycerate synthase [Terriglobia bacterium]
MRIEIPTYTERFGAVRIYNVLRIFELDSGLSNGTAEQENQPVQTICRLPYDSLVDIEKRMAIVVPCKQERLKVLEGVLSGIPHDCLTILVSNSHRSPVDRFRMEEEALTQFCRIVQRRAMLIHQRDPGLAEAFAAGGFNDLLDEQGLVRHGKGEGMLVGLALAKLCGKDFVGFIDADNYVPGAVNEYVKDFAAGLHMAETPYSMVRISWHSKPKITRTRLFFERRGRASEVTNHFLNLLVSHYSGFGTEVIKTGNAGEHAFTMQLGELLSFASGYSVEPYQYIQMLELFGGVHPSPHPEVMDKGVEVFQIETRNPHFHENKGDEHVGDMRGDALQVIYHSPICPEPVRNSIKEYLHRGEQGDELQKPRHLYPPLQKLNLESFVDVLGRKATTFQQIQPVVTIPIPTEPLIQAPDPNLQTAEGADDTGHE